jgi:ribosomal-protein-alanine N-acetyltransferase
MQESDLDEVLAIEQKSFNRPWHRSFFLYDLNHPNSPSLVARVKGRVVGYLIAWREGRRFHIANLAVAPNFRRQKVASSLLDEAYKTAQELGAVRIYLEVRVSNQPAIRLYEKFGFKFTQRRPSYYPDGEDAWVMEQKLGSNPSAP